MNKQSSIPITPQDARLDTEVTRDLDFFDPRNSKEYPGYFEGFSGQKNSKVDVKSDVQPRILRCNRYSIGFGLFLIPLLFGAVHAQGSDGSTSNDPFDLMLNNAREQQRQKITQDFAESQKQNQQADSAAMNTNAGSTNTQSNPGQAGQSMPSQPNNNTASSTGGSPPAAAAPQANIPLPSTAPTNTNVPNASTPTNIYIPPPTSNPPVADQSTASLPKTNNIYQ